MQQLVFDTTEDVFLGWAKHDCQRMREQAARETRQPVFPPPVWGLVVKGEDSSEVRCLFKTTREERIAALKAFPDVVKELQTAADAAVTAIQDAKKLVR